MPIDTTELLADLKRVAEEVGRTPSHQDYRKHGDYTVRTYYNRFVSWSQAHEAAGLEPRSKVSKIPEADLIAELHRLAEEYDQRPTIAVMKEHGRYGTEVYRKRFGSWRDALDTAGYEVPEQYQAGGIDESALLAELRRLAAERGEPLTAEEMAAHGKYGRATYNRHFGSWAEALAAADLEPTRNDPARYTEARLHAELERLAAEFGHPPTTREMNEHGKYSATTYMNKFGSWLDALEAVFEDVPSR